MDGVTIAFEASAWDLTTNTLRALFDFRHILWLPVHTYTGDA